MSAEGESRRPAAWAKLLALLPLAVVGVLGAAFYWGLWSTGDPLPSTLIGKPVPEFSLPPIEGRTDGLSAADLRGEVSLVNVWASWCVPCRVEMPLLAELAGAGTVAIYGINFKDDADAAFGFLAELGDPFTRIGADTSGRVSIDWGVYGVPETFVVGPDGRVAYRHVGPLSRQVLDHTILPLIGDLQAQAVQEKSR